MLLYDVYYEGSRFGGFDAARPLPTEGMDVGDVAVCVNGPKQTLVWDGEQWLDEELEQVDYDALNQRRGVDA